MIKLLIAAFVAAMAVLPAESSAARLELVQQASVACKGSSGHGSRYFYFANDYLENVTADGQYIVCGFPLYTQGTAGAVTPDAAWSGRVLLMSAGRGSTTFTCAALAGSDAQPGLYRQVLKQIVVPAGEETVFEFTAADLPIAGGDAALVVNCLVPAGGRIKSLQVVQPRPAAYF